MTSVLRRFYVGAMAVLLTSAQLAVAADVPSGQPVTLQEVLIDEVNSQTWLRFRFVTPQIAREGGYLSYDDAAADMEHLCTSFALPYISEFALTGDLVVISFSDQETEFGQPNPEATQFFDLFSIENETCIWEAF